MAKKRVVDDVVETPVKAAEVAPVSKPVEIIMPGMIDVVLKRDHRHAGMNYAAGSTITVRPDTKDFLVKVGVI